jgi:uracil-DNA glycosylase family 4
MIPATGSQDADALIVIGEGPGNEEVAYGQPFVGPPGKLLKALITNRGGDVSKLYLTNATLCAPPPGTELYKEQIVQQAAGCCYPRLVAELQQHASSKVLALGKVAAESLFTNYNISERGVWHNVRIGGRMFQILPSWHPAYILRKPSEAGDLDRDIGVVLGVQAQPRFNIHKPPKVIVPTTATELREVLATCPSGVNEDVSFDIETDQTEWYAHNGKPRDAILFLSIAWCDTEGVVVGDQMLYDDPESLVVLQQFFDRTDLTFVAQNGTFDMVFQNAQLGLRTRVDFDTMLAAYILNENGELGLKTLAYQEFGLPDWEAMLVGRYLINRNDRYSKVPFEDFSQYGVWDVVVTRAIKGVFEQRLKAQGLWEWPWRNVIMRAQPKLAQMEQRGIRVDIPYLQRAGAAMEKEMERIVTQARTMFNQPKLNLGSSQQVAVIIYDILKMPLVKSNKVKPRSTSHEAVAPLIGKHEFIDLLMRYRRIAKLKSSYVDNLIEAVDAKGRAHPETLIHGTEIGRLSMRDPAFQTLPRPVGEEQTQLEDYDPYLDGAIVRGSVIADPGKVLIVADYSQAELRVAAHLSEEPFLIEAYRNNEDLHGKVAKAIFGSGYTKEQRVRCKMFNFSYLYGGSEYSFAQDAGLPINAARQFVRDYNRAMPKLAQFRVDQYNSLVRNAYVSTVFGRRRRFVFINSQNRDDARKSAVHAPVAGTASDLTLLSACQAMDEGIDVILMVHDSIVAEAWPHEAPAQAKRIQAIMQEMGEKYCHRVAWKADVDSNKDGTFPTRWAQPPELI